MPTYHKVSTASTNEEIIKSSPGEIDGYYLVNKSDFYRFVKLFDSSTLPNIAVVGQKCTFGVPPRAAANVSFRSPLIFNAGITIAIVSGMEIGNIGAVALSDISVSLYYT